MTELFDKTLLPLALQYGLTVYDFWDMTIKEINTYIKAIQQREKNKYRDEYLEASLTASFVGLVISGKTIPPIYEVFPEIFMEEQQKAQSNEDNKALMLYKEQMLDFAKYHNEKRRKQKEGEK